MRSALWAHVLAGLLLALNTAAASQQPHSKLWGSRGERFNVTERGRLQDWSWAGEQSPQTAAAAAAHPPVNPASSPLVYGPVVRSSTSVTAAGAASFVVAAVAGWVLPSQPRRLGLSSACMVPLQQQQCP
jgi:hypothetical protein